MHYRIGEWTYERWNLRNLHSGSMSCMELKLWRADWSFCLLFCHLCLFLLFFYFFLTHTSSMALLYEWPVPTTRVQTEISYIFNGLPGNSSFLWFQSNLSLDFSDGYGWGWHFKCWMYFYEILSFMPFSGWKDQKLYVVWNSFDVLLALMKV